MNKQKFLALSLTITILLTLLLTTTQTLTATGKPSNPTLKIRFQTKTSKENLSKKFLSLTNMSIKNYEVFNELPEDFKEKALSYENFLKRIIGVTPTYTKTLSNLTKNNPTTITLNINKVLETLYKLNKCFS